MYRFEMPVGRGGRSVVRMDDRPSLATHGSLRRDESLAAAVEKVASGCRRVPRALGLGSALADRAAWLGSQTGAYFSTLATVAAGDLTVARAIEPHLDALTILAQAPGVDLAAVGADAGATWGVFAANAPGHGLRARATPQGVRIDGSKAWCSLAGYLSHALVTAEAPDGGSGLYAVPLRHAGVTVDSGSWVSRGLAELTTSTVSFTDVPAVAVGEPGWYLTRSGFAWGGIAVAAVWFGATWALAGSLRRAAGRRDPDQIALLHLGDADLAVHAARLALEDAAECIDSGAAEGQAGVVLALRTRSIVAASAEHVMRVGGHALGPAPLTQDEEHSRRVADLTVYVRQHHAERDLAVLGRHLLDGPGDAAGFGARS